MTPEIPPDDPARNLAVVHPDDPGLRHVGVAGNIYTPLLTGEQTAGRLSVIDMAVPPGGGPAPHRHDFEEVFILLEGEIAFTFRGQTLVARAGQTVHIPANAPHGFTNASGQPARLLCLCAPGGQDAFFLAIGTPVPQRAAIPPKPSAAEQAALREKAAALAPRYRIEMLPP